VSDVVADLVVVLQAITAQCVDGLAAAGAAGEEAAASLLSATEASTAASAALAETGAAAAEAAAGVAEAGSAGAEAAGSLAETASAATDAAAGIGEAASASAEAAGSLGEAAAAASDAGAALAETGAGSSEAAAGLSETAAASSTAAAGLGKTTAAAGAATASMAKAKTGSEAMLLSLHRTAGGAATAEASFLKAGAGFIAFGKTASIAGLAAAGASVYMAAKFQSTMELIHTQAGASQAEVNKLSKAVLDLAPTVGIGPTKLADGLYHVESAGFRGAAALDIVAAAAKAAAIGQSDMEKTTQALIGVMAVQFKDVMNAADATAFLNTTVGIGDMRMEKLASAIATGVLPSFKSAGLGMTDFSASLATLTDNVTPADEAATRLRMTVSLMAAPSHKAEVALNSIGLTGRTLAEDMHKPNGLLVAVMDLKKHLEETYPTSQKHALTLAQMSEETKKYADMLEATGVPAKEAKGLLDKYTQSLKDNGTAAVSQNQVLQHAFGGGRSSGAMLTLIEESDRLTQKYHDIGNASQRTAKLQDAWKATQQQFTQQMHELGASLQVVAIKAGSVLIPPLQKFIGFLASHTTLVKVLAYVIGTILVAAMIAFTASVIANTIALLSNPVVLIVMAIIAVIALLVFGIYELVKHWTAVWAFLKRPALDVWQALVTAWHATWNAILAVWNWVYANVFKPIGKFFHATVVVPIQTGLKIASAAFNLWWTVVKTVFLVAKGFWTVIFNDLVRIIKAVVTPAITFFRNVWHNEWTAVTTVAQWAWRNILQPTWNNIVSGYRMLQSGLQTLERGWNVAWNAIKSAAQAAWNGVISPTLHAIENYGINPLRNAANTLANGWSSVWGGIRNAVSGAWNYLSGIFDRISSAVSRVMSGIRQVANAPQQFGGSLAHLLGFNDGGIVPGPVGAPMLAVVHGGEFVVSNAMQRDSRIRASSPATGFAAAGMGSQRIDVHVATYLDGKVVYQAIVPHAQRDKGRNNASALV
jgi:TP901 family phage tail tape measure protein